MAGAPVVKVLAYGSNLLVARMCGRAPSAEPVTTVRLLGYALRFHKRGRDGSGKADAFFTGRGQDVVFGVVYELSRADKMGLDLAEGLGRDSFERPVELIGSDGIRVHASVYTASSSMIDGRLVPFSWYKEMVVSGAREHGLPAQYVAALESVEVRVDGDTQRVQGTSRLL